MSVLLIDDNARKEIKRVLDHAGNNIFNEEFRAAIKAGIQLPAGDDANHVCYLENGYRVVYSIDEKDGKHYHHISISIDIKGKLPSVPAVLEIMREFGMTPDVKACDYIFTEDNVKTPLGLITDAINLIQKI